MLSSSILRRKMEQEKKKRPGIGQQGGRRAKARGGEGSCLEQQLATDEEVEEFFTIVGRMRKAAAHFKIEGEEKGTRWRAVEAAGMAGVEEDEGRLKKKGSHNDDDQECTTKSRNVEKKLVGSYQIDLNKDPF